MTPLHDLVCWQWLAQDGSISKHILIQIPIAGAQIPSQSLQHRPHLYRVLHRAAAYIHGGFTLGAWTCTILMKLSGSAALRFFSSSLRAAISACVSYKTKTNRYKMHMRINTRYSQSTSAWMANWDIFGRNEILLWRHCYVIQNIRASWVIWIWGCSVQPIVTL